MVSTHHIDFNSLLQRLDKDSQAKLCLPQDPDYHKLLDRFSDRNIKPAGAIFLPKTAQDVSAAITFVTEHSIDLAVVCGGHSGSGASSTDGGLVIDLRNMKEVTIDVEKKVVTCGGGCLWKDVDFATAEHGLAVVGGTVNHTGVGGLTLGGGYGFLSGTQGLTIDNLLSIEIVLASGKILNASENDNQDLFWAACGAGASFGVVTKFTFQAHEQNNTVYMGPMVFPPLPSVISKITEFLNDHFSSEKDDGKLAIVTGVSCAPPDYKSPTILVIGFYNGSQEEGQKILKPLADLNPIVNHMAEIPYKEANALLAEINSYGDRKIMKGFTWTLPFQETTFLDTLTAYNDFIAKYAHDPRIGLTAVMFECISSKKIVASSKGSFANRGEHFNGLILPRWTLKENDEDILEWARSLSKGIIQKNGVIKENGREPFYANYDDLKSSMKDLFGENMQKLKGLKAIYDPTNLFNKWHNIERERSSAGNNESNKP